MGLYNFWLCQFVWCLICTLGIRCAIVSAQCNIFLRTVTTRGLWVVLTTRSCEKNRVDLWRHRVSKSHKRIYVRPKQRFPHRNRDPFTNCSIIYCIAFSDLVKILKTKIDGKSPLDCTCHFLTHHLK